MTDILTKNFAQLQAEVAHHVHADSIIQGHYWKGGKGCFIGCLSHSDDPTIAVERFGLTLPIMRIAENIFEGLPANEATAFFAAFPAAVGRDGKDLSRVHWQFLSAELRALPEQEPSIQAVIDRVIVGMDLLSNGQPWEASAYAASDAVNAASLAAHTAVNAARADVKADSDAAYAACASDVAAEAVNAASYAAAEAVNAAADVSRASAYDAARLRQRDTLLRLIKEAE